MSNAFAQGGSITITNTTSCPAAVRLYGYNGSRCTDLNAGLFAVAASGSVTITLPTDLNPSAGCGGSASGAMAWVSGCASVSTTYYTKADVRVGVGTTVTAGVAACSSGSGTSTGSACGSVAVLWTGTAGSATTAIEIFWP